MTQKPKVTKDNPPTRGQRCLFWNGGAWELGTWAGYMFESPKGGFLNASHWMPLPPPPKHEDMS